MSAVLETPTVAPATEPSSPSSPSNSTSPSTSSTDTADAAALAPYTGRQKAAILLLELGKEGAAAVLGKLSEDELEMLSSEVARLGTVPRDARAAVLRRFGQFTDIGEEIGGGLNRARDLLIQSVGVERANNILGRVSAGMVELPFHFLQDLDARQITSLVGEEHPQTIAMVLAHLPSGVASIVLGALPADQQSDVAHRIAVMDRTSPELIRRVESSIERRLSSLGVPSEMSAVGGLQPLVDIINRADRGTEKMILEGLEARDPALAELIRNQMFMFDDIAGLDDRAIQLVLRQVPSSDLAPALKGVRETTKEKIMKNMSERAAIDLADELEILGPVRIAVVEEAQAKVVAVVRSLEEAGQIVVARGDEEEFVE